MPRTIRCPQCQQRYSVADEAAGKKLRCPKCQTVIDVPPPSESIVVPELVADEPISTPAPGGYWPGIDAPRTGPTPAAQPSVATGYGPQAGHVPQGYIIPGQAVPGQIVQGQIIPGQIVQGQPAQAPIVLGQILPGTPAGQTAPQPVSSQPNPATAPLDWLSSFDPGYPGYPGHPGSPTPSGYGAAGSTAPGFGSAAPLSAPAMKRWRRKRNVPWRLLVGIPAAIGAGLMAMWCVMSVMSSFQGPTAGGAGGPLNPAAVPLPAFPDRPAAAMPIPGGSKTVVRLPVPAGQPGFASTLYIYLPTGSHAPKSLPCVFYAPAGSTLLNGMNLGDGDSDEHLPWVQAGFAVVAYEQDGDVPERNGMFLHADFRRGYQQFAASQAGLVNARNAIEYTLAKVPEVAPDRLYTAGHSSAGTAALLLVAFEPRIRGCAAFAASTDPSTRPESAEMIRSLLGGDRFAMEFLRHSSPAVNAAKIRCPVFLFHSPGDTVVPYSASTQFKSTLEGQGNKVTFHSGSSGDHYHSMIQEGLPLAIRWMKNLDRPGSGDALPGGPIAKTPAVPTAPFGQTTPPTAPGMSGGSTTPGVPGTAGMPGTPGMPGASGMPPNTPYPGGFPASGPPPAPDTMPTNPGVPPNPFSPAKPTTPNMGGPFGSGFGTTPGTAPGQPRVPKTTPKPKPPKPSSPQTPPPSNGFDLE